MKNLFIYPFFLLLVNLSFAQYTITGVSNACISDSVKGVKINYTISDGLNTEEIVSEDGTFFMVVGIGTFVITPILEGTDYTSSPESIEVTFPNDNGDITNANFCITSKLDTSIFQDKNLEQLLLNTGRGYVKGQNGEELDIDSNKNGLIEENEAAEVYTMNIPVNGISSLVDLKYFNNLSSLYCKVNNPSSFESQIDIIDLSQHKNLEHIILQNIPILQLDLKENKLLKSLDLFNLGISHLDLSPLKQLEELRVSYCDKLEKLVLPIEGQEKLKKINCSDNNLSSLDLRNYNRLTTIECGNNKIDDLLLGGTSLEVLRCGTNSISSLDISNHRDLSILDFGNNQISNIDLKNNDKLIRLYSHTNPLGSIDVSNLSGLLELQCYHNQLSSIDVSKNKKLVTFKCYQNNLKSLDLSQINGIIELFCGNNPIENIILKNGQRTYFVLDLRAMPFLNTICIDSDEIELYRAEKYLKEFRHQNVSVTSFCTSNLSNFNYEFVQESISVSPNPVQDQLSVSNMDLINATFEIFNLQGQKVKEGEGSTSIDVSELSKGIYLLKIKSDSGVYSSKFVKE